MNRILLLEDDVSLIDGLDVYKRQYEDGELEEIAEEPDDEDTPLWGEDTEE